MKKRCSDMKKPGTSGDKIEGNESLVEHFNSLFITPLHLYANLVNIGYLVTEL